MVAGTGYIFAARRRTGVFLCLLLIGLLGGAVSGSSAAAGTPKGSVETTDPVVISQYVGKLFVKAQETWPNEFGTVWTEFPLVVASATRTASTRSDGPGRIFVSFTEGAEEKVAELAKTFIRPDLLVPVTAKHSRKELESLVARIVADQERVRQGLPPLAHVSPDGRFAVGSDVISGRIIIAAPKITDEFRDAFIDEYRSYGISLTFEARYVNRPVDPALHARLKRLNRSIRTAVADLKRTRARHKQLQQRGNVGKRALRRSRQKVKRAKRKVNRHRQQRLRVLHLIRESL